MPAGERPSPSRFAASRVAVHAKPPDAAVAAESAGEGAQHALPFAGGVFLHHGERDMGGIPAIGDADDGLRALCRHLRTGGG